MQEALEFLQTFDEYIAGGVVILFVWRVVNYLFPRPKFSWASESDCRKYGGPTYKKECWCGNCRKTSNWKLPKGQILDGLHASCPHCGVKCIFRKGDHPEPIEKDSLRAAGQKLQEKYAALLCEAGDLADLVNSNVNVFDVTTSRWKTDIEPILTSIQMKRRWSHVGSFDEWI